MDISNNILTTDSLNSITTDDLDQFVADGFAYVKFPNLSIIKALETLRKEAIAFFNLPQKEKEKDGILFNPKTIEGYVDRRKEESKPLLHEQIFFRPDRPVGTFKKLQTEINIVQEGFWNQIAKPLLKLLLKHVLLRIKHQTLNIEEEYDRMTQNIFSSLSLLYYPLTNDHELYQYGLNEHTDQSFITVLWVTQECLQVLLEREPGNAMWHDLSPKPGYAIVNIGNALSAITGNRCRSSVHRVLTPRQERLSIGTFYDPSMYYVMKNILEDTLIFGGSSKEFLKDHFSKTYSPLFEKTLDIAHPTQGTGYDQ